MSYDIRFRARHPHATVTYDEFVDYFEGRKHYEIVEEGALYFNDDTGVEFFFEYEEEEELDEDEEDKEVELDEDEDGPWLPLRFDLGVFRPRPFGLEAEPEVRSFVTHFDLTVIDIQTDGMGEGEYSSEGFLGGWNGSNKFDYYCRLRYEGSERIPCLPERKIESIWRWNFDRQARQEALDNQIIVPRIYFVQNGNRIGTCVAWNDAVPILLPEVDLLLVGREQLGRRRLFRSPVKDSVILRWWQIEPCLLRFREIAGEPTCHEVVYHTLPLDLEKVIRSARPTISELVKIEFQDVVDCDLAVSSLADLG